MQGLVNFAQQIAFIIAVLLPTFLYCSAVALFLVAGWGFWQQSQPDNPFRGRPWVPLLALLMSGFCASFPTIITKVNISGGSAVTMSVVTGLTSYAPVDTANVLGATPGDAVLNIVLIFLGFFQVFGAMTCYLAAMAWRAAASGRSNRQWSGCGVQFVFGVLLMNIYTITGWLVGLFQA